ncbi:hypothetical protein SPRG_11073 [Saprolegnia parasitica CBS 223.65]|uniref:CRAL-TRIO domain-containing protein n=1 Tax=Saprolegnia parasitica (strain CBS 223.65) TaxID=695850 RepID=A0A067C9Z7_SAPPC|nr:hypothetical protein SPRG_11073 [Saprolegnia parasitica CBS 223.65]KDO23627.1 hypothetical protein SPRG_11073 [Saprolegnia parasitica CBS 223.65]|eukprot:XP_012205610.1 hypothetical protein SPRG_11073 [Saprolegnia parasitica CBS 223.65]
MLQDDARRWLASPLVALHLCASVEHAGASILQMMSAYVVYSWLAAADRNDPTSFAALPVVGKGALLACIGHVAAFASMPVFIALYRSFKWQTMAYIGLSVGLTALALAWMLMSITNVLSVMFVLRALGAGVSGVLVSSVSAAQEYHGSVDVQSLLRPHFGRVMSALFIGLCAVVDVAQDHATIHISFMSLMALFCVLVVFLLRFFVRAQRKALKDEEKNNLLVDDVELPVTPPPTVLGAPRPHFNDIRRLCPHHLYGATASGHPIWIVQAGLLDVHALQQAGFTSYCLKDHFAYMLSYLKTTHPPASTLVVVLDLDGLKLIETQGWTIDWACTIVAHLQRCAKDETLHKLYVVNVPFWFSWVWKTIRSHIADATLSKITFLKAKPGFRKVTLEPLHHTVGRLSLLPTMYGGENPIALSETDDEFALDAHITSLNATLDESRELIYSDGSDDEDAFSTTPVLRVFVAPPPDRLFVPLRTSTNRPLLAMLGAYTVHMTLLVAFDALYPMWALQHASASSPLTRLGLAALATGVASGVHLVLRHVPLPPIDRLFALQVAVFAIFPLLLVLDSNVLSWPIVVGLLLAKAVVSDATTRFLWCRVCQAASPDHNSESSEDSVIIHKVLERTLVWLWLVANACGNLLPPILVSVLQHLWMGHVRLALAATYWVAAALVGVLRVHSSKLLRGLFVLGVQGMQREELGEEQNPNLQLQQLQMQQQQLQQQQMQLHAFWQSQIHEISQIDPEVQDFKTHQLPLARIKKIMKSDEDVRMISAEAPVLFAKACEMFILELSLRAWIHTEENKRRTLQRNDIAMAITKTDTFDFLIDIVPREDIKLPGKKEGAMDPQMVYQQQLQQQQAAMLHQFMQSQAGGNPAMWPPQQLQMMQHYQQQLQGMQPATADGTAAQQASSTQQAQANQAARNGVDV